MKKLITVVSLILLVSISLCAQPRKIKRGNKLPTIRATVIVKGGGILSEAKPRNETDNGIWNQIEFLPHRLKLDFPSTSEEIFDEETSIESEKVWIYTSYTERGKYQLIVRDFPAILDNEGIDEILENTIARVYTDDKLKLRSKRTVYYEGRLGKELEIEDKKTIQVARFYILNNKLFAIYVTVDPKEHRPLMEPWIQKFLNSFEVKVPIKNQT